jgi:hypothetical protein
VVIDPSARRHGVADEDITHALERVLATEDAGEEPERWLVIGADQSGNLLELIVLQSAEGEYVVIHAMPMRAKYRRLLP